MNNHFEYYQLIDAVIETRPIILKYFKSVIEHQTKYDDSPITQADIEVNDHLIGAIKKYYPDCAIISEENSSENNCAALSQHKVFIIDPIDGTSSFIRGSKEFSVNIALKIGNELVMGIIYSPIDDVLYYSEHKTLFKITHAAQDHCKISRIISKKKPNKNELTIITTRRRNEVENIKKELVNAPQKIKFISFSSSLKFCYLAEGMADIYYRTTKIRLWDVAAGFALVDAAGFTVFDKNKNNLLSKIFSDDYLQIMKQDDFKVDPFVIRAL